MNITDFHPNYRPTCACGSPATHQCGYVSNEVCTTWLCDGCKHGHPLASPASLQENVIGCMRPGTFAKIEKINQGVTGYCIRCEDIAGKYEHVSDVADQWQSHALDLEKERDQLKADNEKWKQEYFDLCEFANAYEKERDKLKAENEKLTQNGYWYRKCDSLKEENHKLREENEKISKEYSEYKVHYDRIFEKSIVVPTDEYIQNVELKEENQKLRARIDRLRVALCEIGTESGVYSNTIIRARAALSQDDEDAK